MSFVSASQTRHSPLLPQILVVILGSLVLFLMGIGAIGSGYQLYFSERIFPGVSMAGVDLSRLTPEQAAAALDQRLTYPKSGRIVFRYGDQVWVATPAELGMVFDAATSVEIAYRQGRQGNLLANLLSQMNTWQGGLELAPVILVDQHIAYAYLQDIAARMDRPVVEADLQLTGAQVVYEPGSVGRVLNVDKTLPAVLAQLKTFQDGEISLSVEEQAPLILDASVQAESLRRILAAPLTLRIIDSQVGDPGPWVISVSELAAMVSVGREETASGWQYRVSVDTRPIETFLNQLAPTLNQASKNARFYFDDATRQLVLVQSAETGRMLDIPASLEAIEEKLLQGEHEIPLVMTLVKPEAGDDATAESLGITGLVQAYTSYFRGSGAARLQNIKAAASRFYGLLIPPNTTFSMGEAIGDISLDNGYEEALIIYSGKTITGVVGGVCQVSTTLFRTALYGGYPIVERHEHAYRVYYYEQTATGLDSSLAGLDATVYFPLVDLKFTNDRPYWLLMETYFHPESYSLEWKFYSGDDGRTVDGPHNLGLQNVVKAPEPRYEENPELPPGTCKQVDWPGDGADITVTRSVSRADQLLFSDTIRTHYKAWQAVYQYGPGTEAPELLAAQGMCH